MTGSSPDQGARGALRRQSQRAFWFFVAALFLLESWLWDNVREWLRWLGRALGVEKLDPWLRGVVAGLSPRTTLLIFLTPALAIYPVKLIALGLIVNGHILLGALTILIVKALALGVTSYLFDICREKMLQMPWFVRVYAAFCMARAWARAIYAPVKRRVVTIISKLRARIAPLIRKAKTYIRAGFTILRARIGRGRA